MANPIGPGFGNYGYQDIFIPKGSSAQHATGVINRASQYEASKKKSSSGGGSDGGSSSVSSQQNKLASQIGSGWDSYIKSLDDQMGGLSSSRSAQEGIVNSQYNQGVNDLGLQYNQGTQALAKDRTNAEANQVSTLRDLSGNIRNAFQAGNVFLGTRGASDSSAADQYSYALNKMGTQQRSDVMNNTSTILADIDARETNLKNIYDTETRNLAEQKNSAIQQIAVWFADAQNQIKQMQAQGRLNKSQDLANLSKDLLNQAVSKANQVSQYFDQGQKSIDDWAMGVSGEIEQAKGSLQNTAATNYTMPQAQGIAATPTVDYSGNVTAAYGGGGGLFTEKKQDPFGGLFNWSNSGWRQ